MFGKYIYLILALIFANHILAQTKVLFPVIDETTKRIGYVDQTGIFVIYPEYSRAGIFLNGFAMAMAGGDKKYIINETGEKVFDLTKQISIYNSASDGILTSAEWLTDSTKRITLLNNKLEIISVFVLSKKQYPDFFTYNGPPKLTIHDSLVLLKRKDGFTFINVQGKKVIEKSYPKGSVLKPDVYGQDNRIYNFSEGMAQFEFNNEAGYLNKEGKKVIVFISTKEVTYQLSPFQNNVATIKEIHKMNGVTYYLLYKSGKKVKITEPIDDLQVAYDPILNQKAKMHASRLFLARHKETQLYGYINEKGLWQIQPKYYYANPFFENDNAVVVDLVTKKCGLINKSGEIIAKPIFKRIYSFKSGFAPFNLDDEKKMGILNNKGEVIINPILPMFNQLKYHMDVFDISL